MIKTFSKFHKLTICDGLEALATSNYNTPFPYHFHQTYNISLVYEGTFRTVVGGRSLSAPTGSILITNPFEIHSNPVESDETVSFFTFYVSSDFLARAYGKKPGFFGGNVIHDEALFNQLHQVALKIDAGGASAGIEQELSAVLNLLSGKYALTHEHGDGFMNDHSLLFKNYLANCDDDKFSLEQAAKQFGLDKYKFLRLFKFHTGLTPNNYFILKRIEKSKEMLMNGHDILSTAIDLGFYDIPHFSKHFKKFTGISPAAYSAAVMPGKAFINGDVKI